MIKWKGDINSRMWVRKCENQMLFFIIYINLYSNIWQVKQICVRCQQNSLYNFMWKNKVSKCVAFKHLNLYEPKLI